jgi:hypothetical protein
MSQSTPAAPAIPLDILLPRLEESCIPRHLCQLLRKDPTFQQIQFRCQQIYYVRDIAEGQHQIPISISALARAFDCPRSSVQSALAHGLEPPGERGKHNTLDADLEQQILDWIEQKAEQSTPVGKREIKDYCTTELKVPTTRGWVNSFVIRHSDRIFKTKSAPQEQQLVEHTFFFLHRSRWRYCYRLLFIAMIPVGAFMHTSLPWVIADVCIDGLLLTNLLAIFFLRHELISIHNRV